MFIKLTYRLFAAAKVKFETKYHLLIILIQFLK